MNKQIEEIKEMARAIFETGEAIEEIDLRYACLHGADSDSETKFMRIARHLYHNDYRKSTDVAREIFAEIEDALDNLDTYGCTEEGCDACVTFEDVRRLLERLKKKHESEGADDE